VILPLGVCEDLLADMARFLGREEWYRARGIPYRRGYLLSGPPGCGKTSVVQALASHLGLDIGLLSLTSDGLNDSEFRSLLAGTPPRTMILLEDVDCVFVGRAAGDDKAARLTFSGLLNAIDGVGAGEGRILVMTTNHPERLDPALIRPGRADRRCELSAPDASQASRLFHRFFPRASREQITRFVDCLDPADASMASLQAHLLTYSEDPEAAIYHAQGLAAGSCDTSPKSRSRRGDR